jgi:Tol biopolymer transport system component
MRKSVVFLLGVVVAVAPVQTVKRFSDWETPVNLGATVNSAYDELLPHLSRDGRSLYFASDRPGGSGSVDIWVSTRGSSDGPWSSPVNVTGDVNTPFNDRAPALSRDGHLLFFASDRPGGFGLQDIWVSYRRDVHDDSGWETPLNLGPGINGASNDYGPSFLENDDVGMPMLFFGSNRAGGAGTFDIYISHLLATGSFGDAHLITELSSSYVDFRATVRPDGLELFFDSGRPGPPGISGIGGRDLWVSTRPTVSHPWSAPTNVGAVVNGPFDDVFPALSSDGTTLIFASDRPDGFGGGDLFGTSRKKRPDAP